MKLPILDIEVSSIQLNVWSLALILLSFTALYLTAVTSYNLFLHPLHKYPGPLLARASRLWYTWAEITGDFHLRTQKAHERYGDVFRIAPNELSFMAAPVWKDVYSQRASKKEMLKDPDFYANPFSTGAVIAAPHDRHRYIRKLLSTSFSPVAIREREHLVESYARLFISRLSERCGNGSEKVDMLAWYNFFTFDVISDLVLGETFGCLKSGEYHPWVRHLIVEMRNPLLPKDGSLMPLIKRLLRMPFKIKVFLVKFKRLTELTQQMLDRRLEQSDKREDFLEKLIDPNNEVPYDELLANARLIFIAGGETTATQLTTLTNLLLENPAKMKKLKQELEAAFSSDQQITCESTKQLGFLSACIEEGLRLFPPVPNTLPRRTAPGGEQVNGEWIPGNVTVSIRPYTSHRSSKHFKDPDTFVPERWMGDVRYEDDVRAASQPFSTGPRNCIGMQYAYNEMRLILAKVMWHFDLELPDETRGWSKSLEAAFVWNKDPLMVRLKPIDRR